MSHVDFQEYIEKERPQQVMLLHHWDTDGLASARLFLDFFKTQRYSTTLTPFLPTINNYFLNEVEYEAIARSTREAVVVTDFNVPLDVIERLEALFTHVFVFDHHSQTANINKPGVQDTRYPGCSLLVNDYLMQPISLLAILGAVGDQEEHIKKRTDFYPQIEEVMKEQGLSFEEVLLITKRIDTSYIVGTAGAMAYALQALADPANILHDAVFLEQEKNIATDFQRECAKEMETVSGRVLYMPIVSNFSLISEVTRAKARTHADAIVVTDHVRGDMASLYVRRNEVPIDLGCVVEMARADGYNAGGKPEVAGVVLPTSALAAFRKKVFDLLTT